MVESIKETIRGIIPEGWLDFLGMDTSELAPAAVDTRGPMTPPRADAGFMQTNTITVNPHPNQSPEEIGQEVMRQIEQKGGHPWGRTQNLYDTPEDAQ